MAAGGLAGLARDTLAAVAAESGLELVRWYGVRVAVDLAELDPPAPASPGELAALLDVEEFLGRTDPYRQLAQLAHLVLRRPHTHVPGIASRVDC